MHWLSFDHDHNCKIVVILSLPLRKFHRCCQGRWDPKQYIYILSTFATFLLLSYSKLLSVSCNFLFAIKSYNSTGDLVPDSTVLPYDPNIPYFKPKHVPYIIIGDHRIHPLAPLTSTLISIQLVSLEDCSYVVDFDHGTFFTWSWTHCKTGTKMEQKVHMTTDHYQLSIYATKNHWRL